MTTKIPWADETWNPVTGCTKISAGCKNCYAERMSKRLAGRFGYPINGSICPVCGNQYDRAKAFCPEHPNADLVRHSSFDVTLHPDKLDQPLHWKKPRRIFVCSMSDFFHVGVPFSFQCEILQVIGKCPQHTFMILTKRTEQLELWNYAAGWHPYPNLWLGVTVENQEQADKRIPVLLETPAAVRFVSVEPMLGPVQIRDQLHEQWPTNADVHQVRDTRPPLDWVICGAETGPGARPMDLDWARDLRDQCAAAGVPFFFKRDSDGNRELDGRLWEQWPEVSQ